MFKYILNNKISNVMLFFFRTQRENNITLEKLFTGLFLYIFMFGIYATHRNNFLLAKLKNELF